MRSGIYIHRQMFISRVSNPLKYITRSSCVVPWFDMRHCILFDTISSGKSEHDFHHRRRQRALDFRVVRNRLTGEACDSDDRRCVCNETSSGNRFEYHYASVIAKTNYTECFCIEFRLGFRANRCARSRTTDYSWVFFLFEIMYTSSEQCQHFSREAHPIRISDSITFSTKRLNTMAFPKNVLPNKSRTPPHHPTATSTDHWHSVDPNRPVTVKCNKPFSHVVTTHLPVK